MSHAHGHGNPLSRLGWALGVTLAFSGVEAVGGWWSGSLALLSDAGHMLSDALALGLALLAAWVARRPPSRRHTYGLMRAEVVAALANALLMLVVVLGIAVEAVERTQDPRPVAGFPVMVIAAVGLLVNLGVLFILGQSHGGLNVRAAALHVTGDLLGSAAALTAGAVVYFTGWTPIDPLLAVVVACLILASTVQVVRGALTIIMEGVPSGLDLEEVGRAMTEVKGVTSVHDLHVWTVGSEQVILSAHVVLDDLKEWPRVLAELQRMLRTRFRIGHVTLQPEVPVRPEAASAMRIPIVPAGGRHS